MWEIIKIWFFFCFKKADYPNKLNGEVSLQTFFEYRELNWIGHFLFLTIQSLWRFFLVKTAPLYLGAEVKALRILSSFSGGKSKRKTEVDGLYRVLAIGAKTGDFKLEDVSGHWKKPLWFRHKSRRFFVSSFVALVES